MKENKSSYSNIHKVNLDDYNISNVEFNIGKENKIVSLIFVILMEIVLTFALIMEKDHDWPNYVIIVVMCFMLVFIIFYIIFHKKTIRYIDNKIFFISNRQDIELDINEINSFSYEIVKLREIEHHVKINIFIENYNIYFECSDNKNLETVLLNLLKRGIPQVDGKKKQLLIDNSKKIKF